MAEQEDKIDHTSILVIFAGPESAAPLRLGTEDRIIRECLDRSRYRESFELEVRHAATPYDVTRALLGRDYSIVQFSGHGAGGELVLENEHGQPQVVPQEALAELLSAYSPPIECVMLNACSTEVQGELVSLGVPYTIAISGGISDAAAREFTRGFYDAIGAGKDYRFAFQEGSRAVNLAGLGDGFKAVLLTETRDEQQTDIRIVSQQQVVFDQEEEEEEGFLDYILDGTESFEQVSGILGRITDLINNLGRAVQEDGAELKRLMSLDDQPSLREYRRILNRSADTMETFARELGEETPAYRDAYSRAIDCYGRATSLLTTDFGADSTEQVEEALSTVKSLEDSIIGARAAQSDLRGSIAGLPRMTRRLNRAKRVSLAAIDDFDREMEAGLQLTLDVKALMENLLVQ